MSSNKISRFPLWMLISGSLLLLINFFGLFAFLTSLGSIVPGLENAATPAIAQISYQIGARQFIPIVIFIFAFLYKDARVAQIAWFIAFIREIGDLAGALANPTESLTASIVVIAICMAVEIGSIIYLNQFTAKDKSNLV